MTLCSPGGRPPDTSSPRELFPPSVHEDSSVSIVADIMSNRSCIGEAGIQNNPAGARGRRREDNGEGCAMDWQTESPRAVASDARD